MDKILEIAESYYKNRGKLIYSYRGNTFLQGGELFDPDNDYRGRIDCSTLVHLALAGITYENSPYVTKDIRAFFELPCKWIAHDANFPLTEAAVFAGYSGRSSDIRRAYGLAKYCRENGLEIDLRAGEKLEPGDLMFFQAAQPVIEEYWKYGAWMAISHVGIVAEDTAYMLNATGRSDHIANARSVPVRFTRIADRGVPVLAARIAQK